MYVVKIPGLTGLSHGGLTHVIDEALRNAGVSYEKIQVSFEPEGSDAVNVVNNFQGEDLSFLDEATRIKLLCLDRARADAGPEDDAGDIRRRADSYEYQLR